jgi:uncharacterized protein YcbK (DUF882 family)
VRKGRLAIALCFVVTTAALTPSFAGADRTYTVRDGDTAARIAQRHRIPVSSLLAANRMGRADGLRPGQELLIPDPGVVYVRAGQTLSHVARNHDVTVAALARTNRIRPDATLREGQRLILPGAERAEERERAERRWGQPRHPGVVTLVRAQTRDRLRLRLVDTGGRARRAAVRRLVPLMRENGSRRSHEPHRRLVAMLAQISDHFGGREIHVISGFRRAGGFTSEESRHTEGRAMDIRVRGVPNTALRDYCRTLDRAGCGFYPHSSFVHVDARDRSAYWVDTSSRGEMPKYHRELRGEPDAPNDEDSGTASDDDGTAPDAADADELTGPEDTV